MENKKCSSKYVAYSRKDESTVVGDGSSPSPAAATCNGSILGEMELDVVPLIHVTLRIT